MKSTGGPGSVSSVWPASSEGFSLLQFIHVSLFLSFSLHLSVAFFVVVANTPLHHTPAAWKSMFQRVMDPRSNGSRLSPKLQPVLPSLPPSLPLVLNAWYTELA